MTPESPFPALIETGKSHPKTGLCRWLCPAVPRWFAGGLGRRSHRHLDHHHKRVQVATTSRNAGGFGGPVANPATQDLEGALNSAPRAPWPEVPQVHTKTLFTPRLCPLDVREVVRTARPTALIE